MYIHWKKDAVIVSATSEAQSEDESLSAKRLLFSDAETANFLRG
jgi:hypothetical protein